MTICLNATNAIINSLPNDLCSQLMDEDQRLQNILQILNVELEDGSYEQKLQVFLIISNLATVSKNQALTIANHNSLFQKIYGEKGCLSKD